jgi:hypothetical protein
MQLKRVADKVRQSGQHWGRVRSVQMARHFGVSAEGKKKSNGRTTVGIQLATVEKHRQQKSAR